MKKVVLLLAVLAMVCGLVVSAAFAETTSTSYTLTVASANPSSGVSISVSPTDLNGRGNGTTQFTRNYRSTTSITLTAPSTANGNVFKKWQRDGVDYSTSRSITFSLSGSSTMTAVYVKPTYTLTVASSNPSSGVAVSVSPTDLNGQGSGTTQFTRSYSSGTSVTLTASSTVNGNVFRKWQRNGVDYSTSRSITFSVSGNSTMTAVYVTGTYTLTVASSNPSSGVAVSVSPTDLNGRGNGTTQFTRSYRSTTSITLTAPATANGNAFLKWQRNGADYSTSRAITFSLSGNSTMTAVFGTATTTSYVLTVASSNPSSGVAVSVSPVDASGQGGGSTQFTRSYSSGTSVTLTAPATASGNTFQKWQKNGVDAATTQAVSLTMSANTTMTAVYAASSTGGTGGSTSGISNANGVTVLASNDLGMHCTCPEFDYVTVLPPFNTLRAQVFVKGSDPRISTNYTVSYSVLENTDAVLKADPYYQNWMKNAPKLFPGFNPINASGQIQGLTGATLSGNMIPNLYGYYEAKGVPVFPVVTGTAKDVMVDPLGGPNRDPYLTWQVNVKDSSGNVVASTQAVSPVAFGGCCNCHLKLAQSYGVANPTPADSFKVMGMLHGQNTSGIDLSYIDTDGDGVPGPIRCSYCHLDPAMGESVAPGLPAGYKILPGATFSSANVKTSLYTFSDVLHRFHAQDSVVLSSYDPNIAKNCYDCHPGNGVNCYRDTHTTKTINGNAIWCTDCHGDLNQRIASGSLTNPWNIATLPTCATCHGSHGESTTYSSTNIFGSFLGSRTQMGLCSSCHGSPHGLNPSTLPADNAQNIGLQNDSRAIGNCSVCHTNEGSSWGTPPHSGN